jgi:serine/threonine-protein kinase
MMNSPTLTAVHGTQLGVILGTAAYMAPEQAKGKAVDRRGDIWAFGVVLFEMLTGRRLFAGETVSDVLAAVLTREPDWSALPVDAAFVAGVLERCLERDPRRRMRDAGDVRLELERASAQPASSKERGAPAGPSAFRRLWIGVALVAGSVLGVLAARVSGPGAPPVRAPRYLSIQLGPERQLAISNNGTLTFSPDGRSLVFAGTDAGRRVLLRRRLDAPELGAIEGTEGGGAPAFSADGRSLGFVAGGKFRKLASEGGRPLDLAAQQGAGGGAWLPDGEFVFAPMYSDGLFRIREGSAATRLTTPDRAGGELGHWWPCVLPSSDFVLFTGFRTPVDTSRVRAVSLSTGEVHDVVEGGFFGRYVPGYLLYAKGGRLYAAPFDPARAVVSGPARAVLEDVYTSQIGGYALFDVSSDGTLAYVSASVGDAPRELVWVDRDGRVQALIPERRRFVDLSLSPDDRTVALTIQGDSLDLWALEIPRGTLSRVTAKPGTELGPLWAKDRSALLFVVDRPPMETHRIPFGSSAEPQPLWKEPAELDTVVSAVSPDGRTVAYRLTEPETGENLWVRGVDGNEPARSFRATPAQEQFPTFSPDGRWLAYESDETGRPEVYVEAFPGPGSRHQVSADGGSEPLWARNGELFYRHDAEMRVVTTRSGRGLEFDPAKTVYSMAPYRAIEVTRTYDVTADGRRVLTIRTPEATAPRRIEIVTDWLSQLPRLARGEP